MIQVDCANLTRGESHTMAHHSGSILDELFPADNPLPPRDVVHRQYEFEGEYGERGELKITPR